MNAYYSTQKQDIGDNFSYWQDVISSIYIPSTNRQLSEQKFDAELSVKAFGASTLSKIQSDPVEYQCKTAFKEDGQYFLSLSLSTNTFVTQNGITSEQNAGEIVIFDSTQPFTCHFPEGDDQIVLAIPHELLELHVPAVDRYLSQTLKNSSPMTRLLGSLIQETWNIDEQVMSCENSLLVPILDIVNTAFTTQFNNNLSLNKSHHDELITRAKSYLLNNLDNRDLTLEKIAESIHVSSRTLNRIFSKEGTTAMRWLWQQRLKASHTALMKGQFNNISDVALTYGFSNPSHFSRVFKDTYGITPNQTLKS
ncbi:AraC family transcriptional regulator [Acinetobacter sp. 8I-beige]|uniref:helix-turn-helix domain-containing protein n=1 Tax=Acinetobacter sp. 8I-beige TaxID=2653125 RepID=UPI0012EF4EFE|nr:helix-turn-helix domain-containing protein [Acinetobacter sp. 8I-beige]VXA86689.1 AraC family transcriptional regulator [Acinetobacter sp. 8I-beige]